jgi:hypothetical protein
MMLKLQHEKSIPSKPSTPSMPQFAPPPMIMWMIIVQLFVVVGDVVSPLKEDPLQK